MFADQILKKEPRDLTTWTILANSLLILNIRKESIDAFENIIELNPDEPRANLYIGISKHDKAINTENNTFDAPITMLEKAFAKKNILSEEEQNLLLLYLVSSKLHSQSATLEIQPLLEDIDKDFP